MDGQSNRRPPSKLSQSAGTQGFVVVDALVALLILSATLVFCLDGLRTADHLARVTEETGQASRLGRAMLSAASSEGQTEDGRVGTLRWRVEQASSDSADHLCRRTFFARSLRDGRVYRFSTAQRCG